MTWLFIFLFMVILSAGYAGLRGAPWVPTWSKDVERFLALADLKPGDKFYDLGCGDGRLLLAAVQIGAKATGYEISLFPYLLAKIRQVTSDGTIKVKYRDFWLTNIHEADVVYFFLMPEFMPKLKVKLETELKSGTRVIAYVWPIPGWTPVKISEAPNRSRLYLYRK